MAAIDAAEAGRSRLRRARTAGAGIVDQGFVSLANFALGVIVARLVSAEEFGAFSAAFAVYLVALNVARMLGTQPLLIRLSAGNARDYRAGAASATGASVVIGAIGGLICVAAGLLLGGTVAKALIALGAVLPSLLLQDAWRFTLFGARRGEAAVVNDVLWVIVLIASVALIRQAGIVSVQALILAWGAGATASALGGIAQARVMPRLRDTWSWLVAHRDISVGFLGSELTQMASSQLVLLIVGAIAGLAALGSLRAAQLLLGPFNVISVGINLAALPEATRLLARPPAFQRFVRLVNVGLGSVAAAWSAAVLLLPDSIGRELLGDSWPGAHLVLLPVALSMIAPLVTGGDRIALRAIAAAVRTFRASGIQAAAMVALGLIGAIAAGAVGAAWGLAAGGGVSVLAWWYESRRGTRTWFAARELRGPISD